MYSRFPTAKTQPFFLPEGTGFRFKHGTDFRPREQVFDFKTRQFLSPRGGRFPTAETGSSPPPADHVLAPKESAPGNKHGASTSGSSRQVGKSAPRARRRAARVGKNWNHPLHVKARLRCCSNVHTGARGRARMISHPGGVFRQPAVEDQATLRGRNFGVRGLEIG